MKKVAACRTLFLNMFLILKTIHDTNDQRDSTKSTPFFLFLLTQYFAFLTILCHPAKFNQIYCQLSAHELHLSPPLPLLNVKSIGRRLSVCVPNVQDEREKRKKKRIESMT